MSWDYFDIGLFEFDSGYVEAIEAIVEAEGHFDFIYIQAPYSETLTNLLQMISELTIRMLMNHFGLLNMNKTKCPKYVVQPLHYRNIEERNNKLEAGFSGQYGDKVSPKLALVHPNFKGDVFYQGNSELTLSGEFEKNLNLSHLGKIISFTIKIKLFKYGQNLILMVRSSCNIHLD